MDGGLEMSGITLSTTLYIVQGIGITLQYALFALIGGFCIGLLIALLKLGQSRIGQRFADIYVSIFRGTPLLVQLSLAYFALPQLIGHPISAFTAGIIAFSLNSGAYVSEVIRAGIQGIDKGQFEASMALGIPRFMMLKDIIFPQAFRNVFPAFMNEMINLLKETALLSTIGEADIMRRANLVAAEQYNYIQPLLIAASCYYVLVLALSRISSFIERKMNHDYN
jgi:His/Glu/Gln/Arg/opine family amino acid ABC transporter permease subunit